MKTLREITLREYFIGILREYTCYYKQNFQSKIKHVHFTMWNITIT